MNSNSNLFDAAEKISAFGKQFCSRSYSTSAKAWKFNPDCALAGVGATVNDDNGSVDADQAPVGALRLTVDIEFFRHDKTPANAAGAEDAIIDFAKSLGFEVKHESNIGSGEFGTINQLLLT